MRRNGNENGNVGWREAAYAWERMCFAKPQVMHASRCDAPSHVPHEVRRYQLTTPKEIVIEFILTQHSFQYFGTAEELQPWEQNKYQAWYAMPWRERKAANSKSSSERLFATLSLFFHKRISATRDINFLRENVVFTYKRELLNQELERASLASYLDELSSNWLDEQFAHFTQLFKNEIVNYPRAITDYYQEKGLSFAVSGQIFFHLAESKLESYPFAFMASYTELENGHVQHYALAHALEKYKHDQAYILQLISSLSTLEKESNLIRKLMSTGELFQPIYFTDEEAYQFLQELELYERVGIRAKVPRWWTRVHQPAKVQLKVETGAAFSKDKLLAFRPEIEYNGITISPDELEEFLHMSEGLHAFKGTWIEVDHKRITELLAKANDLHDQTRGGLSLLDSLQLATKNQDFLDISCVLSYFKEALNKLTTCENYTVPASVHANLRAYQLQGYLWLRAMDELNLGVILADDMGLGKTLQIIAYLDALRTQKESNTHAQKEAGRSQQKVLIVMPSSLLANWEEELKKFAPYAPFVTYHGKTRTIGPFITLTSYGMLKREAALLQQQWDVVILDEAQAIKNTSSQQAKAVKVLHSRMKIALTGTPIENDLMDLFSIFDFILPGYLGTAYSFQKYARMLETKTHGYQQLQQATAPFIMRRVKTDKAIIHDLPKKMEHKEYIDLTPKQAALYRKTLAAFKKAIEDTTNQTDRRGMIFTTLTHLKQITNHPSQYSGNDVYKPSESGKFIRLAQLVEEIYNARERVLIFTQYKEIIPHLSAFLCDTLGRSVQPLVLHGGVNPQERQNVVNAFNGDSYHPFMILSLRAGGVGLNLTGANHVIHFDRWWNPQIEKQASDRAYRIGQTKDVMVHYFICRQTLDMSIDALLEKKKELSTSAIAENKAPSLTTLSNKELFEFFGLRKG